MDAIRASYLACPRSGPTGRCINIDPNGMREPLEFRLTMGLRKIAGEWRVMREQQSLPATQ